MNLRVKTVSLIALSGLICGASATLYQGTALGQPEFEELVSNTKIDCSTNPAFNDPFIVSAFKAGGAHSGGNQQCGACHPGGKTGMGDKPIAKAGSSLLQNRLTTPISYSVQFGKNGKWEPKKLQPGGTERISYKYTKANQNKSPKVLLKFTNSSGREELHRLDLLATPNPKLGSVYFFDKDRKQQGIKLLEPHKQPGRRK